MRQVVYEIELVEIFLFLLLGGLRRLRTRVTIQKVVDLQPSPVPLMGSVAQLLEALRGLGLQSVVLVGTAPYRCIGVRHFFSALICLRYL